MVNPTLNAKSLGDVQTINFVKDANIIPIAFPGGDSDDTETFDLLGVTRIMTVSGLFGGETADVKVLVDDIEAEINGDQASSVVFNSDQTGSLNVKVASFDVTWEVPSNKATYNLKLIEGV